MKKWLLNLSLVLIMPIGIVLLDGCYPNDSISTSETDIVLTGYYDSVDFFFNSRKDLRTGVSSSIRLINRMATGNR